MRSEKFDTSLIGTYDYIRQRNCKLANVAWCLANVPCEIKQFDSAIYQMIELANGNLLGSSWGDRLFLLDENLNLVKQIDAKFRPNLLGLTKSLDGARVYVSSSNNALYMLDGSTLEVLKTFRINYGNDTNEMDPFGEISFANNQLHVCNIDLKAIQIFNEELELVRSIPLNYAPYEIRINGQTMCVRPRRTYAQAFEHLEYLNEIYFYAINDNYKLVSYFHSENYGFISIAGSYFYELCFNKPIIYYFNENGALVKTDTLSSTRDLRRTYLLERKNNLIISAPCKRQILCFDASKTFDTLDASDMFA